MTIRKMMAAGTILLMLLASAYVAASVVVYNTLAGVEAECGGAPEDMENTPAAFGRAGFNTESYYVADFVEVQFPSRDRHIEISAFYMPANAKASAEAPAVIVVHGLNSCKRRAGVLTAAGMLHNNGFTVLAIDMRDHGDSTIEDGRMAAGTEEYRDVLGAWDWLQDTIGIPKERIGIMGFSFGAATVNITAAMEPNIAAVWSDSSYADIPTILRDELNRAGYPQFLGPGGMFVGKLISGDDLDSISPLDAARRMDGRPYFVIHGDADTRIRMDFAHDLAEAGEIMAWIVPGSDHVEAIFDAPEEYENRLIDFFRSALSDGGSTADPYQAHYSI